MKNKKVIIVSVVFVLLVFVGGYFFLPKKDAPEETISEPQIPVEEAVNILSPEDLGLTLSSTVDKRKAIMEIVNTGDISSLDYELSYTAEGNIPRGVIGHIDVKSNTKPVRQEIVLGTCSDVCHYDKDVSDIKIVVKVTKTDNKVYSVEKSLDI